jgi:hypothetical protein
MENEDTDMISERIAFQMVVTATLLVALVIAPAAARDVADDKSKIIEAGDIIYVGEENLNFATIAGVDPATAGSVKLVHFTDKTADRTIIVPTTGAELKKSDVGTTTGSYYVLPNDAPLTVPVTGTPTVEIQIPQVVLDVRLYNDVESLDQLQDSMDGKSVTRKAKLIFRVDTNLDGFISVENAPTINIDVTLPGGGVMNEFRNVNLKDLCINKDTTFYASDKTGNPVSINLSGIEGMSDATAGAYTAIAKWPSGTDFYGKGFDSNTVTFEVLTKALGITANKDSVVCGNSFTVTITGKSVEKYNLCIKDASIKDSEYPWIVGGQKGFQYWDTVAEKEVRRGAVFETTTGGTRTIQFDTNTTTDDRQFTIRVEEIDDPTTYDEVKVRVEEGDVTITASGTGVYCIGEEITLSGTCTEGDNVYLFMTGPNLRSSGVNLTKLGDVETGKPETFTVEGVEADDTWSYKWNTGDIIRTLDAGGYTIYAVSKPVLTNELSGAKYATVAVQLRPPSLTARTSGTTLTRGEDYRISGTATGADCVQVWLFGKNYYKLGVPVLVESDGSFEYVLAGAETSNLAKGQYYIVVQHPMREGFGVYSDPGTGYLTGPGIPPVNLRALQASDAATALINALDSPNVDDAYIKFSFSVDVSRIWIDGLSDQTYGEAFTVTGTTDYPAGTALTYRITATEDGANVLSGETVVGDNGDWSFEVDTTVIGPGAYALSITAPDGQASTAALFDIYDDFIHPIPQERGSYRVERVVIDPSLNVLSPGERVALDGIIGCRCPPTEYYGCLEFSTDLQDPVWSYILEVDGQQVSTGPMTVSSRSFALSGWELSYGGGDVRICLALSGTVPEGGTEDRALLRILERDAGGRVVPASEYRLAFTPTGDDPAPPFGDNLTLQPGWNFVSVPRPLAAGSDTASIFASVETAGHSALRYDTAAGKWVALTAMDRIVPLEGTWIYSTGPATVPLRFSTDLPLSPAERSLTQGWNAVGITGTAPATARGALLSVSGKWTTLIGFDAGKQAFETGIVSGESNDYADSRLVYQGKGYWLYMTDSGTLCAIGV